MAKYTLHIKTQPGAAFTTPEASQRVDQTDQVVHSKVDASL